MIESDTKHPPEKYLVVRGYMRTVGGNTVSVRAHLRKKRSFWDVFAKTPDFDPSICGKEEERT